jgi:hypothetical protein
MSAAVGGVLCSFIGLAAAGITEFQRGRAGFPVADFTRILLMFFTTCTGVFIDAPLLNGGN